MEWREFHSVKWEFHRVKWSAMEGAFQNRGREGRGGSRGRRRERREQWRAPHRSTVENGRESHISYHPREESQENA